MIKVTLKIENKDITISRDYLFDSYEELMLINWNTPVEDITEVLTNVPFNETNNK